MNLKRTLLIAAAMMLAVAFTTQAQAQGPFGFGYGPYGGFATSNYGFPATQYGYRVPAPPYFAVHPPVYYSDRVYRPYGLSPYAWPAHPRNFQQQRSAPCTVTNHFVPQSATSQPTEAVATTQPTPKMIINPFVEPATEAEQLVKTETPAVTR